MLEALTDNIDDTLDWFRTKWFRPLNSLLILLGVLVGVGLVSLDAAKFLAVAIFVLLCIATVAYLALELKRARSIMHMRAGVLNRYIKLVQDKPEEPHFKVVDWNEEVVVSKGGDAVIVQWIEIKALRQLHSFRSAIFKSASARAEDGGMSTRQVKKVRVTACRYDQNRAPGTRYDSTHDWEFANEGYTFFVNVHFQEPVNSGATARVRLKWTWPKYYDILLNAADRVPVQWRTRRPFDHIKSTITFDKGCKLKRRPLSCDGNDIPLKTEGPDGSITYSSEFHDVPVSSDLGYYLDRRPH
jgi:hypothetical protein